MESVLGLDSNEELAADLSQLSTWQGGSQGPSYSHKDPYADFSHKDPYANFSHKDPYANFSHKDPYTNFSHKDPYADFSHKDPYADFSHKDPYTDFSHKDPYTDFSHKDPYADYSHHDPYADSSIISGTQPALPMDQRENRPLMMKRKVLRHRPDGRVEVSDESQNAKPWNLGRSRTYMDDAISEGKIDTRSGALKNYLNYDDDDGDDWFPEDSPPSLRGDSGSDTISEYPIPRRLPTNYIAPQAVRVKRTDPVAKLNDYKQDWEKYSIPGQDAHQSLRWAVRRQMLQPGLPRRAQKHIVLNNYEVPTMKKRDSLRFGVRWDLAHKHVPRRNAST